MKTLSALATVLAVLGFTGAAFAQCASRTPQAPDQTAETPVVIPQQTIGS